MNNESIKQEEYPLFTVIIPQKNRAEYLVHTLKTCMIQDYPNFEVIVSDDCSDDNSVEVVERLAKIDNRIKLFAHKQHLGMRDNFEFALNQVKPGYVMALGGDDGLAAGCLWKMYQILNETKLELLTWPAAILRYPNEEEHESLFYFRRRRSETYNIIKSEDFLNKISSSLYYLVDDCPMFYIKGVASTNLVNRVKSRNKDNSFYTCPTPDGFSGVVLAGETEEYVYTYEPLSVGGTTTKSQGLNYKRSDKKSREESEQSFNDNIRRTMHKELASQPYSPLITLMTADYLLTAKDLPGWPGKFKDISFDNLLRKAFAEMAKSEFQNELLIRELKILKEIAKQHNLLDIYEYLYKNTIRKVVRVPDIRGLVVTNSIRIDGSSIGINNVFDASIVTPVAYLFYKKYVRKKTPFEILKNGIKVILRQRKYKKEKLPIID